jgi:hypothetical protein
LYFTINLLTKLQVESSCALHHDVATSV